MYYTYKISNGQDAAYIDKDGIRISFVFNESNPDYQAFLRWCEEGNTPEQAD
jgi:hypothetical protein